MICLLIINSLLLFKNLKVAITLIFLFLFWNGQHHVVKTHKNNDYHTRFNMLNDAKIFRLSTACWVGFSLLVYTSALILSKSGCWDEPMKIFFFHFYTKYQKTCKTHWARWWTMKSIGVFTSIFSSYWWKMKKLSSIYLWLIQIFFDETKFV